MTALQYEVGLLRCVSVCFGGAAAELLAYFVLDLGLDTVYFHQLVGVEDFGKFNDVFFLQVDDAGVDVEAFGDCIASLLCC